MAGITSRDYVRDVALGVAGAAISAVSVAKPATFDPAEIRVSQTTVSYKKVDRGTGESYNYDTLVASMRENGWQKDPVDLIRMPDGKLTSMDNTRIAAAREAGIEIQGVEHAFDEPLTLAIQQARGWEKYTTWGEAITGRINAQRPKSFSSENPYGSPTSPKIIGRPEK